MTALALRKVDAAAVALRSEVAAWQKKGMKLRLHDPALAHSSPASAPAVDARYLSFQAAGEQPGSQWEGWICCDEWLGHIAPALAALATRDRGLAHATQLFAATPQPLSSAFAYQSIVVTGDVSGADLQHAPLVALTTPEATIWLRALPPIQSLPQGEEAEAFDLQMAAIPASLQFLLGASRLSQGCLSRVGSGDVLLISDHALHMRCNGLVLGWYSITDEGITVEELLEDPYEEFAVDAEQAGPEYAGDGLAQGPAQAAVARIPVRLEFVLQQNRMTIGQLGQLHAGQIISLTPDAEKQVLVLANGAVLGRGELVQLEDRLGVEMIELYGGEDHAD